MKLMIFFLLLILFLVTHQRQGGNEGQCHQKIKNNKQKDITNEEEKISYIPRNQKHNMLGQKRNKLVLENEYEFTTPMHPVSNQSQKRNKLVLENEYEFTTPMRLVSNQNEKIETGKFDLI